ncbi:MAG: exonuclease domain-containing protein [Anaerolineae bacterium]
MSQIYVALDLETTGLDAKSDAIIEIGCVKLHEGEIVDQWSTLVSPGRKLAFVITQLTGIADRDLIGQPSNSRGHRAAAPLRRQPAHRGPQRQLRPGFCGRGRAELRQPDPRHL